MTPEERFNEIFTDEIAKKLIEIGFAEIAPGMVLFKLQDGPIKEVGKNGCQIDVIIEYIIHKLKMFDAALSCFETRQAISKLEEAVAWLNARTKNRIERGVEGTNAE